MNALRHIRKGVLALSQAEIAAIAGVSQGTVSKWETGELDPSLDEMSRIRTEAKSRGIEWDDGWFFEVPSPRPESTEPHHQHDDGSDGHRDQRPAAGALEVVHGGGSGVSS